jgi:hypothetical protein
MRRRSAPPSRFLATRADGGSPHGTTVSVLRSNLTVVGGGVARRVAGLVLPGSRVPGPGRPSDRPVRGGKAALGPSSLATGPSGAQDDRETAPSRRINSRLAALDGPVAAGEKVCRGAGTVEHPK